MPGTVAEKPSSGANAESQRQAEDKLRQSYQRLEFLANATSRLDTSRDYKTMIAADICVVDLGAWGMGHGAWGMGQWAWGIGHGASSKWASSKWASSKWASSKWASSKWALVIILSPFPFPLFPSSKSPLPNAQCPMPITHYPLPITHYPLPITHYPLPITRLLPIEGR